MKHSWFSRHPICFMALYLLFYLSAFNFLETRISMPHLVLVHCRLDDLIPFCKYAVIPYFAWFVSHVGIYVGDGVMIHCGDPIQYTSINSSYWQQHFYAFGRPAY